MVFRLEEWCVRPTETPRVWRHCAGCKAPSPFISSNKFRVNAQKKLIDVWLVYRCSQCDATWNYPIVERRAIGHMHEDELHRFLHNDADQALRYAFDIPELRRKVLRVEPSERIEVFRTQREFEVGEGHLRGDTIRFSAPLPTPMRVDRVLSAELHISRSELRSLFENGKLIAWRCARSDLRTDLRSSVQDGLFVCFVGARALGLDDS